MTAKCLRIEGLTKDFGVELVVAESVLTRAGISGEALDARGIAAVDVDLRGREGKVRVRAFPRAVDLG